MPFFLQSLFMISIRRQSSEVNFTNILHIALKLLKAIFLPVDVLWIFGTW